MAHTTKQPKPFFKRAFYGLSKDEMKVLEMKKLREGKSYAEVQHEIKRDVGVVIRQEIAQKEKVVEYKETHKNEVFKDAFDELRKSKRNRD